jgi:DNA-binding protein H-NS
MKIGKVVNSDPIRSMGLDDLLRLRREIDEVLSSRRDQLARQIELISASVSPRRAVQAKIEPRYRSKKDPKLQWSGRGDIPRWMRSEMKGTKLTKEDFRIPRK